ncbi:ABC transporter permease [Thermoactinomyces mirandus]|uniref:ABC transporter permease n=1 Tax=Thermoactinomyces mirandus TaxID=2756294 RepID=A0A7W2AQA4_9BACL|nr:ABC transporter permease [Thermoactinomyces mirandus]MBA4601774.1 ABC transporter permease [Thermoactinomyces mirandus]
MVSIYRLIQNESMKVIVRTRTFVFLISLLLFSFLMAFFRLYLERMGGAGEDVWGFLLFNSNLLFLVELFAVIIASDIVSSEFTWGTATLLCVRPVKRWKILLSKYVTVVLFTLVFVGILMVSSILFGMVFFGFPVQSDSSMPLLSRALGHYGIGIVEMLPMITLAFTISSISKSNSFSVGCSLFALFGGTFVVELLRMYGFQWAKYLLFANLDLEVYIYGGIPAFPGMTLSFSLINILVHFICFLWVSWWVFTKRDITMA